MATLMRVATSSAPIPSTPHRSRRQIFFGTQDHCFEINKRAAEIARRCSNTWSTEDRPRFVAGSIGATNRTASISPDVNRPEFRNVDFDQLCDAYSEAAFGLIKGGIDLFLIETVFNTLNAKIPITALLRINEPRPALPTYCFRHHH